MNSLESLDRNIQQFQENILADMNVFINKIDNEILSIEKSFDIDTSYQYQYEMIANIDRLHQGDRNFTERNRSSNKGNQGKK